MKPDSIFFQNYWEKKPVLMRKLLLEISDFIFSTEDFYAICNKPAVVRAYRRTDLYKVGGATAIILDEPSWAPDLYELSCAQNDPVTILLNQSELVSDEILKLREDFKIGRQWRYDDIVTTLSSIDSGIGFHAGHEDGFICQIKGARNWKVYHPDQLPTPYLTYLLGNDSAEQFDVPERPSSLPLLDLHLEEGDVLYLPPLYGHEGVTLEESLSISIAWKGITPKWFLVQTGIVWSNEYLIPGSESDFFYVITESDLLNLAFLSTLFKTFDTCLNIKYSRDLIIVLVNYCKQEAQRDQNSTNSGWIF